MARRCVGVQGHPAQHSMRSTPQRLGSWLTAVGVEHHVSQQVSLLICQRHVAFVEVQEEGVVLRNQRLGSGGIPEPGCEGQHSSSGAAKVEV